MAILHVEDEAVIRDVVQRALEARGFPVVAARGVRAASLALSERNDITGVLLDVRLPDGSGVDVYQWITAYRPTLAARVAFVTGSAGDMPPGLLASLGRPILRKPFAIKDLVDLVSAWH